MALPIKIRIPTSLLSLADPTLLPLLKAVGRTNTKSLPVPADPGVMDELREFIHRTLFDPAWRHVTRDAVWLHNAVGSAEQGGRKVCKTDATATDCHDQHQDMSESASASGNDETKPKAPPATVATPETPTIATTSTTPAAIVPGMDMSLHLAQGRETHKLRRRVRDLQRQLELRDAVRNEVRSALAAELQTGMWRRGRERSKPSSKTKSNPKSNANPKTLARNEGCRRHMKKLDKERKLRAASGPASASWLGAGGPGGPLPASGWEHSADADSNTTVGTDALQRQDGAGVLNYAEAELLCRLKGTPSAHPRELHSVPLSADGGRFAYAFTTRDEAI